jgi:hypothetical protein
MAGTTQSTAEKIEIVDQPEELLEQGKRAPWLVIALVTALAALGAFFLIRRLTSSDEQ